MFLDAIAHKILKTKDYSKLILWTPKLLLGTIFLWPRPENNLLTTNIACIFTISIMSFIEIGLVRNLPTVDTMDQIIFNMALIIGAFQSIYKILIIWYQSKSLKILVDDIMTKFWPYNLIEGKLEKNIKDFYILIMSIIVPLLTIGMLWGAGFLLPPLFMEERSLPFPVKYSFDWKASPIYEIMYIFHCIGYQIIMVCSVLGVDFLFISVGASAVSQYRILQQCLLFYNTKEMVSINTNLKNLKIDEIDLKKNDITEEYFVRCLKHHQLLIRFTKNINDIFSLVVLVQLSCSVTGICLAIFLMTRPNFSASQLYMPFLLTIAYLNQLFVYCIIGNQLYHEASLLPEFIYRSNWRNLPSKELKRDMMFFLQHSQKFPHLSAYNLYDLNMTSFLKVVKLSFSFYTLLSSFSER